jgi:hypothetical protein
VPAAENRDKADAERDALALALAFASMPTLAPLDGK